MRADNLAPFLSVLLDKHHVTPRGRAKMAGVVVGIARPNEAVIRHLVPFFACDFARFATDAHSWIGEEPYLNVIAHVGVAALICAVCAFADHGVAQASGLRVCFGASGTHTLLFFILILFLPSRGPRRFALFGKTVLLDAKSLAHLVVHIC